MKEWIYLFYVSLLFISATVSLGLTFYVWRWRKLPGVAPFATLTVSSAWWALGCAYGTMSSTLSDKLFWLKVEQIGLNIVPVAWLAFVVHHLGMKQRLTKGRLALVSFIPLLTILFSWTNDHHHLMWQSARLGTGGLLPTLVLDFSLWFWIAVAYLYVVLLVSVYLIVRWAVRHDSALYRQRALVLLVTVSVPWVINIVYVFFPALFSYLDPTPAMLLLAVASFVWGLSSNRMLDVLLLARNAIIDWMSDGVILLDANGRIRDLNPAAQRLLNCDIDQVSGRPCAEVLPDWEEWSRQRVVYETADFNAEIVIEGASGRHLCDVRVSPLYNRRRKAVGHLLVLRDVTEQKETEEMLRRRERFLRCVAEISQLLLKESNLSRSLPRVLQHIGETADVCRVALFENHKGPDGELRCSIRYEWRVEEVPALLDNPQATNFDYVANGLTDWMESLSRGEMIICNWDDLSEQRRRLLREYGIHSVMLIPLFVFDSWHGFIGLHICDREREWLPAEVDLLRVAAGDVASSIERDLVRSRDQAMTEAVAAITSTLDFEQILDRILEQVSRVIPNDAVNVMLVEDNAARIVRWRGYERFGVEDFVASLVLPLDSTPNLRRMMETREPMVISDTFEYEDWVRIPVQDWLRSYASAPIIVRDEVVGFLNVDSAIPGFFSPDYLAPLRTFAGYAAAAIENARLFDSLRQRVAELEAIRRASLVLTSSLDLQTVLEVILDNTFSLLDDVSDAHIFLYQDERLTFGAAMWADGESKDPWSTPRPNGLTYTVARRGKAIVVPDMREHPLFADVSPKWNGAIIGLPLKIGQRVVGVMNVAYRQPRQFSEAELETLRSLADQAAIAIENARLFQAEQRQTRRLALLADIARIVATTLDADEMLQGAAESIQRHFAYQMVTFFLLNEEEAVLELCGYSSDGNVNVADVSLITPGEYVQSVDEGIIGYTVRSGQSYYAPDTAQDPHFLPVDAGVRSELCIPIIDDGHVIGALDVESREPDAFNEHDISLLEAVADTVATGLRNIRLYEEARNRVRELTFLNRIAARLGEAREVDEMINAVLRGVYDLLTPDRAFFITIDQDDQKWCVTHSQISSEMESVIGMCRTFDDMPLESQLLLAGRPLVTSDVESDPRLEISREMYQRLDIQSIVLMPVKIKQRLKGTLGVAVCCRKHVWQSDEVRLLEGVAHQLELAIENAMLIEETYRRNAELEAALARQEELDRLKDEFIQNVSHELRTPLALILGYAEMLVGGDLGELQPEQRKPVEIIARRARMLSSLVEDITLILEAEASPPKPQPIHLDELALDAVDDFQVAAEQAGLTLHAEIERGLPPVKCVPTYLRRVLDNLLGNAAKFTPEGGSVTIRVWQDGEYIALAVSDTGVGIPQEKLGRIFERFYQVDGSARRKYGGVGLGLALVKEIAETYGGSVEVESEVGKGSTFTVRLPVFTDTSEGK